MRDRIRAANLKAAACITEADPRFIGVAPAAEVLEGFDKNTILHSGPPIAYEKMCPLHKRGMVNAVLFEGLAKTEEEADRMLSEGAVKVDSAFNYNTVGSGVGIVTASVPLLVCEDSRTGKRAGVFPHEGKFGGGFCGWGVYSPEIKENLTYMGETLFAPISRILQDMGGLPLFPIIAKGLAMGDENHSSQTAVDALFIREILPHALACDNARELLLYFASANRFFHNFGQAACRSALLSAEGIPYSTVVTAAGGNGVEYGIQIAGLLGQWFTAPSPMIEGRYMTEGAKRENQLPWIGDSSVVECAGLGGILSAASPTVCSYRGESYEDGIRITREMEKICVAHNDSFRIPNLCFDPAPVGIDVLSVVETGILPVIDGGMIDVNGGWMGAGCARIPMECFVKAKEAFEKAYGKEQ